jgi:predicted deacetylase
MKFAIRDDDLNYFYTPKFIEDNIKDIWDICPFSMSAVPFIKGNWIENTKILEGLGPNNIPENIINNMRKDNKAHDIAKNIELVKYIKNKLLEGKIYLTIHAIHHRNEDRELPIIKNNFPIGAEFYTQRDLSGELKNAKEHLENTFGQKIFIFTPPQNLYSKKGFKAILNNSLGVCSYLPSIKNTKDSIEMLGILNYLKVLLYRLESRRKHNRAPYPKLIQNNPVKIMDHRSLQPGTNIKELYDDFDYIHTQGGDFVLSTHSYGFNYKMQGSDKTMGEILKEFLLYAQNKNSIEFVGLNKIFEEN